MRRSFMSFMAGMTLGVLMGALLGEKEKIRIRKILNKQAGRLHKAYEHSIREGLVKVKRFVKAQLHQ